MKTQSAFLRKGYCSPHKLGEDSFAVVEKWDSMDALKAHARSPHMADYAAKVKDMTATRAVHVLSDA